MTDTRAREQARSAGLLAQRLNLGAVAVLDNGLVEIVFEGQVIRIAAARYWTFMELMSEASRQFVQRPSSA